MNSQLPQRAARLPALDTRQRFPLLAGEGLTGGWRRPERAVQARRSASQSMAQATEMRKPVVPIFAVAGGTFIVAGVIVAIIVAIAFSFYTYKGSAINAHPNDGLDGAPDAGDPSQPSGRGRTPEDHPDEFGPGGGLSTHGTK